MECGLRRADDHAAFVDPDAAGHVDDAKERIDGVSLVDQRGMRGREGFDDLARSVGGRVERDGDDVEAVAVQLFPQRLPPGQVKPAASPRGPGDEQHLLAAQVGEAEPVPAPVGEFQLRRVGAR